MHAVAAAASEADPDVVIHAAAVSSAEAARRDPARSAWAVNVGATALPGGVGRAARSPVGLHLDRPRLRRREVLVSRGRPGRADPGLRPDQACGRAASPGVQGRLVARLSLLYGPSRSGRAGFFDRATAALASGSPQAFFTDEYRTPLGYETAARILVRLAEGESTGLVHLGGPERLSRFELMRRGPQAMGLDPQLVRANFRADVPTSEPRPADVSLDTSMLRQKLPDLELPGIEESLAGRRSQHCPR